LTLPVLAGVAAGVVLVTGSGPGGELLSRLGLSSDVRAAWEALCAGSQALTGVLAMLVRTVPSSWWYTAVLGCAVWYAGVVALGLTAYRLLRTRD
jgi:hypothetical protein